MQKNLSKLEQKVSESQETPIIRAYQSNSEEKIVIHIECSFKRFYEKLQEEIGVPLNPALVKEIWNKIPKNKYQKVCLELVNELSGQDEYEAGREYMKKLRQQQNEMKSIIEVYENSK